jgi:hypothetical protein
MEQAIARDPGYGPALAWAAFCCARLMIDGESQDLPGDRQKGIDFARRALKVAGDDPAIIANAAEALAYFGEDIGTMMTLVDRALALTTTNLMQRSGSVFSALTKPLIQEHWTSGATPLSPCLL